MIISPAKRLNRTREYYFSKKLKEIAALKKAGKDILNLGIGSPDLAPPKQVIDTLNDSSSNEKNHAYQAYKGIPEYREAIARWYQRYFQVELDPETEILPCVGSKAGIFHVSMAFVETGDEVLIPNPGYPAYQAITEMTGATCRQYHLKEKNHYLPDLEQLEKEDLSRVKIMWLNYPHMPTGTKASKEFFEKLVAFARRNEILLVNDNPYSFILNPEPLSLLSIPGAKEVALELNSLSKSHNLAGWRIGMILGAKDYMDKILAFYSNISSGFSRPVQEACIAGLELGKDWFDGLNQIYGKRKEIAFEIFDALDCTYQKDNVGLFLWGRIPGSFDLAEELSDLLLSKADVFITPGLVFGSEGNKHLRISLCSSEEDLREALKRIKSLNIR